MLIIAAFLFWKLKSNEPDTTLDCWQYFQNDANILTVLMDFCIIYIIFGADQSFFQWSYVASKKI